MMKKKILAATLAATMVLSLTACGGNKVDNKVDETTNDVVTESIVDTEVEDTTTDVESSEVVEDSTIVEESTEVIEDTTTEPEVEDTLVDEPIVEEPVIPEMPEEFEGVFTEVRTALGDNYFPNMPMTSDYFEMVYGVNPADVDVAYGEMPMISTNIDTLVGFVAKEGSVENVVASLENYINVMKEDTFQYPMNLAKIPAMEVVTVDNYVFLVATFGDVFGENQEPTDAEILAIAEANVATTVDTIKSVLGAE